MCVFYFFFSSRRRHTRSLRDWSSDVCSSDLKGGTKKQHAEQTFTKLRAAGVLKPGLSLTEFDPPKKRDANHDDRPVSRSEERRVGKREELGGRRIIKKKKNKRRVRSDR